MENLNLVQTEMIDVVVENSMQHSLARADLYNAVSSEFAERHDLKGTGGRCVMECSQSAADESSRWKICQILKPLEEILTTRGLLEFHKISWHLKQHRELQEKLCDLTSKNHRLASVVMISKHVLSQNSDSGNEEILRLTEQLNCIDTGGGLLDVVNSNIRIKDCDYHRECCSNSVNMKTCRVIIPTVFLPSSVYVVLVAMTDGKSSKTHKFENGRITDVKDYEFTVSWDACFITESKSVNDLEIQIMLFGNVDASSPIFIGGSNISVGKMADNIGLPIVSTLWNDICDRPSTLEITFDHDSASNSLNFSACAVRLGEVESHSLHDDVAGSDVNNTANEYSILHLEESLFQAQKNLILEVQKLLTDPSSLQLRSRNGLTEASDKCSGLCSQDETNFFGQSFISFQTKLDSALSKAESDNRRVLRLSQTIQDQGTLLCQGRTEHSRVIQELHTQKRVFEALEISQSNLMLMIEENDGMLTECGYFLQDLVKECGNMAKDIISLQKSLCDNGCAIEMPSSLADIRVECRKDCTSREEHSAVFDSHGERSTQIQVPCLDVPVLASQLSELGKDLDNAICDVSKIAQDLLECHQPAWLRLNFQCRSAELGLDEQNLRSRNLEQRIRELQEENIRLQQVVDRRCNEPDQTAMVVSALKRMREMRQDLEPQGGSKAAAKDQDPGAEPSSSISYDEMGIGLDTIAECENECCWDSGEMGQTSQEAQERRSSEPIHKLLETELSKIHESIRSVLQENNEYKSDILDHKRRLERMNSEIFILLGRISESDSAKKELEESMTHVQERLDSTSSKGGQLELELKAALRLKEQAESRVEVLVKARQELDQLAETQAIDFQARAADFDAVDEMKRMMVLSLKEVKSLREALLMQLRNLGSESCTFVEYGHQSSSESTTDHSSLRLQDIKSSFISEVTLLQKLIINLACEHKICSAQLAAIKAPSKALEKSGEQNQMLSIFEADDSATGNGAATKDANIQTEVSTSESCGTNRGKESSFDLCHAYDGGSKALLPITKCCACSSVPAEPFKPEICVVGTLESLRTLRVEVETLSQDCAIQSNFDGDRPAPDNVLDAHVGLAEDPHQCENRVTSKNIEEDITSEIALIKGCFWNIMCCILSKQASSSHDERYHLPSTTQNDSSDSSLQDGKKDSGCVTAAARLKEKSIASKHMSAFDDLALGTQFEQMMQIIHDLQEVNLSLVDSELYEKNLVNQVMEVLPDIRDLNNEIYLDESPNVDSTDSVTPPASFGSVTPPAELLSCSHFSLDETEADDDSAHASSTFANGWGKAHRNSNPRIFENLDIAIVRDMQRKACGAMESAPILTWETSETTSPRKRQCMTTFISDDIIAFRDGPQCAPNKHCSCSDAKDTWQGDSRRPNSSSDTVFRQHILDAVIALEHECDKLKHWIEHIGLVKLESEREESKLKALIITLEQALAQASADKRASDETHRLATMALYATNARLELALQTISEMEEELKAAFAQPKDVCHSILEQSTHTCSVDADDEGMQGPLVAA